MNKKIILSVLVLFAISAMMFSIPDAKATDSPGSATHLNQSQSLIPAGNSINIVSQPFPVFDPKHEGFTQELYGASNMFFGGVSFSRHGDPIVNSCQFSNSALVKFINSSTIIVHGTTVHPPTSPYSSPAGCGMTNSPDHNLYSNTSTGVRKFNDNGTELPIAGVLGGVGVSGNALGIAVQPGTGAVFYVTASPGDNIQRLNVTTGVSTPFVSVGGFVDQIVFDGTGKYLYLAERVGFSVKVVDTTIPAVVQSIPLPTEPDGMAIHIPTNTLFVVSTSGTIERVYLSNSTSSTFASGGFRGDNSQVGPDGCLYLAQDGTRYNDGTTTSENSIVRVCPNFVTPPGVNHPPVANDDFANTDENTAVTINVLSNDSDPDGNSLAVTSNTTPTSGGAVINPDNTITYTPNTGFVGDDTFQYSISDGHGGHATATVHVTVGIVTYMDDNTASFGLSTFSGRQIHAEFVSPTSQLIGKSIDTITVKLQKKGSPTGTIQIGIFNADLSVKKLFATKDVSTLTSKYADYTFTLPNELYTISSGDRIGIKFTGGDAINNICIMTDRDPTDPFDGINSYQTYYDTAWRSFTANDLYMKLQKVHQAPAFPITLMDDNTASIGLSTFSGRQIHAEFASPTSQLIGKTMDTITLKLKKAGSPTGTAQIGIFNTDLSVKKLFGTKDVASLTGNYADYTFTLPNELYTISSGDRIGIQFTGGDATNNVGVMIDNSPADPFDGINSYQTYYDTAWRSFTANDLYMELQQTHP